MEKLIEVTRQYDRNSINRHSERILRVDGSSEVFLLDRTTDTNPRFFTLYELERHYNGSVPILTLGKLLPVDGKDFWGDNISWHKAMTMAEAEVTRLFEEAE